MTTVLRRTIQGQRVTLRRYPNVDASRRWEVLDEAGAILGTVRLISPGWWRANPRGREAWSSETRDGAVALLLQAVRAP